MTTVVMTMNVDGLTHAEFRAIMNEMDVEARPEPGIYEHISHPTETGMRIIEVCPVEGSSRPAAPWLPSPNDVVIFR